LDHFLLAADRLDLHRQALLALHQLLRLLRLGLPLARGAGEILASEASAWRA